MAKLLKKDDVKENNNGSYEVQTRSNDRYAVNITLPRCECLSWKKTKLPCKHIFAVMLFSSKSWTSLPESYRNSVYMTLDEVVVGKLEPSGNSQQTEECHQTQPDEEIVEGANEPIEPIVDLPRRIKIARTKFSECRELLNEIKSLTFVISDDSVSFFL